MLFTLEIGDCEANGFVVERIGEIVASDFDTFSPSLPF
jgi:hypothetical protein